MRTVDLTHATEIKLIGQVRKDDVLIATTESGIWTLRVTRVSFSRTGKQITITAKGEDDAALSRLRHWESTHRSKTLVMRATGLRAYRLQKEEE